MVYMTKCSNSIKYLFKFTNHIQSVIQYLRQKYHPLEAKAASLLTQ